MKLAKQLVFSIIIFISLSSFGLINNSTLLQKPRVSEAKIDSLRKESNTKRISETVAMEPTSQQKEINKQEQEEEKAGLSLLNQVAYVILLGIKSIVAFAVKLFML